MAYGADEIGVVILNGLFGGWPFTPPARFAVDIERMEQDEQLCLLPPGYFFSPLGVVLEFEQSLVSIGRGAGVGLQNTLPQSSGGTALSVLDRQCQEQGQGKDGDEEIKNNGKRDTNSSRQPFEARQLARQESPRRLAGVKMMQILPGSRRIDQAGTECIAGAFNRLRCPQQRLTSGPG